MTTIQNIVPKLTIPTVASLIHGQDIGKSAEDQMFENIAEKQIDQEKDDTNFFFKMLDYLGRPQAAVAGVLTDAIDGGDFSPLDRMGRALAGKERYGIKDFIDVISPGDWKNVKLPDWLGGKEVDIAKEVVGFAGDVLTDPLMAMRTFSFLGKAARFDATKANRMREWMNLEGKTSHISERLGKAVEKERRAIGTASGAAAKYHVDRTQLRELHNLWEEAVKDPKAFETALKSPAARAAFAGDIDDATGVLARSFTHTASPILSERFAANEQALLAIKMPWLMRKLGMPDGQWSLIPKLDRDMGTALARGFESMTAHVMNSPVGLSMKKGWSHIFRTGTGHAHADAIVRQIASKGFDDVTELDETMKKVRKAIGSDYNNETALLVTQHLMHTEDLLGKPLSITAREIPDNALREKVQQTVRDLRDILDDRARKHRDIPGALKHKMIKGIDTPRQRYEAWAQKVAHEAPEHLPKISSYNKLRNVAKKNVNQQIQRGEMKSAADIKEIYRTQLDEVVKADVRRGAEWVDDMVPLREDAYFPRHLTDDAKAMFEGLLFNPGVMYKGKPAGDVFFNHFKTRNLTQYDVTKWNDMFREMESIHAPGYMEAIVKSAHENLRGQNRNIFQKFMGELELPQLKMYMDDPLQATAMYVYGSAKAVSHQERMNQMTKMFSRPLGEAEDALFGEVPVVLSPEGMRAVYGDDWRNLLGENAAKVYDQEIARGRLTGRSDLGGLFFDVQNNLSDLSLMKANKIPIHAVPGTIMDDMLNVDRIFNEPQSWIPFLKTFDEVTNWWKGWTLAVFPSYHARNFVSGFWQSFIADSASVKNYAMAVRLFRSGELWRAGSPWHKNTLKSTGERLQDIVITDKAYHGRKYTGADAMADMNKHSVEQGGFYAEELINQARGEHASDALFGLKKDHPLRKTIREFGYKGKGLGTGFWAGNMADNWHRTSHFVDRIGKGYTPYEAAQSVKKYFFDYRELGTMERSVFRRAFPFYTWTRKNIPLQLEMLATKPGKYGQFQRAIEFFQSDEAKEFDKKLLPKWVQDNLGVPTRINKKTGNVEVKMLNTWSPAGDLKNMSSISTLFENFMSMSHPLPKVMLESHLNYSTFTRKPIENFPGEPYGMPFLGLDLTKKGVHKFKSLRLASELNKLMSSKTPGGEVELTQRIVDAFGFIPKTKAFDIEALQKTRKFAVAKRKAALKRGAYRAKKVPGQEQKYIKRVKSAAGIDT